MELRQVLCYFVVSLLLVVCEGFQPHHHQEHHHHESSDSHDTKLSVFPPHGHQTEDHHTKLSGFPPHGHQTNEYHTKVGGFPPHGHQTKDHHTKISGFPPHGHQTKDMPAATKADNYVMRKENKIAAAAKAIRKVRRRENSAVDVKANGAVADIKRSTALIVSDLEVLKYRKLQATTTTTTQLDFVSTGPPQADFVPTIALTSASVKLPSGYQWDIPNVPPSPPINIQPIPWPKPTPSPWSSFSWEWPQPTPSPSPSPPPSTTTTSTTPSTTTTTRDPYCSESRGNPIDMNCNDYNNCNYKSNETSSFISGSKSSFVSACCKQGHSGRRRRCR